jgi:hypothetical protein
MKTGHRREGLRPGPTAILAVGANVPLQTSRKTAKSAKKLHPKSLSRDAAFIRSFRGLAKSGSLGTAFLPLVCICASKRLLPAPTSCTTSACSSFPAPCSAATAGSTSSTPSPALSTRRITAWYERFEHPTYRAHWIGAPWRDTTPYLRGEFAHYALKLEGETVGIALNLGAEIERKALGKADGAKRYLTERIDHHLEVEFGRKVEFWFRLEAGDGPHNLPFSFREPTSGRVNLHLHGEVGCSHAVKAKLRRALQKAGGKWESRGVRYQAQTAPNPDSGYVSYAFKNDPRLAHRMLGVESEPSWCDDLLMVSLDLKRRSKALYESVRGSVRLSGKGLRKRRTAVH